MCRGKCIIVSMKIFVRTSFHLFLNCSSGVELLNPWYTSRSRIAGAACINENVTALRTAVREIVSRFAWVIGSCARTIGAHYYCSAAHIIVSPVIRYQAASDTSTDILLADRKIPCLGRLHSVARVHPVDHASITAPPFFLPEFHLYRAVRCFRE